MGMLYGHITIYGYIQTGMWVVDEGTPGVRGSAIALTAVI